MNQTRIVGNYEGEEVVALVTDLEEFINAPPSSQIFVHINNSPTTVIKGDVHWTHVESPV